MKLYENHGLKSIELLLSPMDFQSSAKNSELAINSLLSLFSNTDSNIKFFSYVISVN